MRNLSLICLIPLGLAACGGDDPPTPTDVRAKISTDLAYVLREANAASAATESLPGADALGMLERVLGEDTEISARVRTAIVAYTVKRELSALRAPEDRIDGDAEAAQLNDELFSDANHRGDGIYNIPPEMVCMETTIADDGTETEALDPECAARLEQAELRIRVSTNGDTMTFTLQVGAQHDEPLSVALSKRSIALTVDLDDAWRAAATLATVFGESDELPNAELSGQITGKLEIIGAAHAKASLTFDRALSIKFAEAGQDLDGPTAFRLASAKANVFALTMDGNDKSGELAFALGETRIHDEDDTETDLAGATMTATATAGQPLVLSNVGLGNRTTTVAMRGVVARTIDVNPLDGRTFGATISHDDATGFDTLTVTPKLDLRTTVDHSLLGEGEPVYDVTQLFLDGQLRGSAEGDRIEVLTGTFSLVTDPSEHGFAATAGQCVTGAEALDAATGAYYTKWTAGTCL
ncbi:MAG TPA: hypothetical protein VIU61_21445 [Kofleriaceae bacterium]